MFNTEKLIQEIKQRGCLWNINLKSYSDKASKRKAWEEIGATFYHDWNTFSFEEKSERVDMFIKKWRNVRDYYLKEKKNATFNPPEGVRRKKKYYFHDLLSFLDAVITLKPCCSRKRTASHSDSQDMETMTEDYLEDSSNDVVSYERFEVVEDASSEAEVSRYIKMEEVDPITSKPLPFEAHVVSPLDKTLEQENFTANQNFLLSLLPDVSSLNERQNMQFRLGVLNLLNDIKFGDSK